MEDCRPGHSPLAAGSVPTTRVPATLPAKPRATASMKCVMPRMRFWSALAPWSPTIIAYRPQRTAPPPPSAASDSRLLPASAVDLARGRKPHARMSSSSAPLPRRTSAAPWRHAGCGFSRWTLKRWFPAASHSRTRGVPISIASSPHWERAHHQPARRRRSRRQLGLSARPFCR